MIRVSATAAAAVIWALAGNSPASATVPPVGAGPTHYTVQPQPPAGSCHYWYAANGTQLPDPTCTPGAISPAVRQSNLTATICRAGYTGSLRPSADITTPEKRGNAQSYDYRGDLAGAEYDYVVPLELGGDPNDARNLWIHPAGQNGRTDVGRRLNALVCGGGMTLAAAQEAIAHDWTTALPG